MLKIYILYIKSNIENIVLKCIRGQNYMHSVSSVIVSGLKYFNEINCII